MAEQPPLNRIYVLGYSANDRDYPIVSLNADPRVAGYQVPKDLSACPDKRYPTHVFTGAQPISGDERVRHVWEILPSPWVPFTRYDDDLGPVQGRRRSVKNEGQVASLTADKRTTYEAREGSAIVYTELEETWEIKVDEDGNSLFPIRDRDFYDASRGPVQERRQLFVPTGEEVGSLENVNGVITQTSYEPYNEFLSIKIVQTYKVDGPKLVGKATDNDGQLVTVTTQRKGADGYIPPNPTATRTVEVAREDAESIVERIVDTPEVFKANTFSVERPDPIPQKFRVAVPLQSSQEVVEGEAEIPTLSEGQISKTEEQRNKFIKRVSSTSRDQDVLPQILTQKSTNNERQEVTITETLQSGDTLETPTATKTVESEALGDGNYVIRKTEVENVFGAESYQKTKADLTPQKFRAAQEDTTFEQTVAGQANANIVLAEGEFAKSEQQINNFVKRVATTSRAITEAVTLEESILTPEGLVATRILTLASGSQTFVPNELLIDANVEALGDGRTVKTETRVPKVFKNELRSVERPDNVPAKFRATIPTKTTEETKKGTIETPELISGQIAKSEQQVTEFVKRIRTTERASSVVPEEPFTQVGAGLIASNSRQITGAEFTTEFGGGYANVIETYPFIKYTNYKTIKPEFGTVSDQIEDLGDGTAVRRQVKLEKNDYIDNQSNFWIDDGTIFNGESLPILEGQEYDQELDLVIPFKQVVAAPEETQLTKGSRRRVAPRDILHSVVTKYDIQDVQNSLDIYYWEIPDMINVKLPDKLLQIGVAVNQSEAQSEAPQISGDTYSYSQSTRSSVGATLSYKIENGFDGVVPTIRAIFFLPKENALPINVLEKINSRKSFSEEVRFWPNARPEALQFAITETSNFQEESNSVSFDSVATSTSVGSTVNTSIVNIPPAIRGVIPVEFEPIKPKVGKLSISYGDITANSSFQIRPTKAIIPSAYPEPDEGYGEFPIGKFLYQINATPYRFSYVRVDALIVDIKKEYV